jgi:hypothetical protein
MHYNGVGDRLKSIKGIQVNELIASVFVLSELETRRTFNL